MPMDLEGKDAEQLTTHAVVMDDLEGQENDEEAQHAARSLIEGASILANTLRLGQTTLVHCEWGQNGSLAIACAYAVLCEQWSAAQALEYVKQQNLAGRKYQDQHPMNNEVFNGIIHALEARRDGEGFVGDALVEET